MKKSNIFELSIYMIQNTTNVETGPKRTSILDDLKFHFFIKEFQRPKKIKKNEKIIEKVQYFEFSIYMIQNP